jgi:hypothetical protein
VHLAREEDHAHAAATKLPVDRVAPRDGELEGDEERIVR